MNTQARYSLASGLHHIEKFFLGIEPDIIGEGEAIGDDADMEVGRILAESTGAEFQGVTEGALANVLEEFSKYF